MDGYKQGTALKLPIHLLHSAIAQLFIMLLHVHLELLKISCSLQILQLLNKQVLVRSRSGII